MQTPNAKRPRCPEEKSSQSCKKPKAWDPKDLAQVPKRKSFPTKSLDSAPKSSFDIGRQLEKDEKEVEMAIKNAKTPEQLQRARKAAEYIKEVCKKDSKTERT